MELTPSVAVAFPRSPTVLAQQAWDLHANSGGRCVLGLGSQVKGHNERRFGIAWTPPAPRLRDYVRALRAVWRCWETRGKLDFDSPNYKLSLMTPDFSPEPTGLPMVPVTIAAVGEAMLRVAGQVADGVRLHPSVLAAVPGRGVPAEYDGGHAPLRPQSRCISTCMAAVSSSPAPDEATVAAGMQRARRRIGFYGSTRTYMPILALHGLAGPGAEAASHVGGRALGRDGGRSAGRRGAHLRRLRHVSTRSAAQYEQRFGGVADSIDLQFPPGTPLGCNANWSTDIRRIPHSFAGFDTNWQE